MRRRLEDGEHPVEEVQLLIRAPAARPAKDACDVEREARAGRERRARVGQPLLMVREQLVGSLVRAPTRRSVGREQRRVGQREHALERGEVVAQRERRPRGFEADRRGDVRQDVVAGEEESLLGRVEDEMAPGVTGRVHRVERERVERDASGTEPHVGILVERERLGQVDGDRVELVSEGARTEPAESLRLAREHAGRPAHQVADRLLLLDAERHLRADRTADRDGLRVVVAVDMRDQHAADVREPMAEVRERPFEELARHVERPPTIDEDEAVAILDRIHVDRTEPVHRERQRDPVHARRDRLRARFRPGVTGGRIVAGHASSSGSAGVVGDL